MVEVLVNMYIAFSLLNLDKRRFSMTSGVWLRADKANLFLSDKTTLRVQIPTLLLAAFNILDTSSIECPS